MTFYLMANFQNVLTYNFYVSIIIPESLQLAGSEEYCTVLQMQKYPLHIIHFWTLYIMKVDLS